MKSPLLRQLVQSRYIDLLGAVLVFGVCYYRNFHQTMYYQGAIQFGIPTNELWTYMEQGAFPLGILSTIGAVLSLLGTRLVGQQNNWGNFLNIFTAINSGVLDYLFGNASAIITYPLSFFIVTFAFTNWKKGQKIRKIDTNYYLIVIAGLLLGFALVYLGAYLFGGRTDHTFLAVVSLTFGLSLGGNFCNALKYEESWLSWIVYNIVQLAKNTMQMNLANVVKYIYYLCNAFITLFDWKLNGDVEKS